METICAGVPIICWPFLVDQQTNCHYAYSTWEIGLEVKNDVKSDEVASLVHKMMEGDKGKKPREKALEWKKKEVDATDIGGSSCLGQISYFQFYPSSGTAGSMS